MQSLSNVVGDAAALPVSSGAGRGPPTPQAWESVKPVVQQLYELDDRPLREVKEYLEKHHGFRASERMYKDRLRRWGFFKNSSSSDWIALAVLYTRRKAAGKRSTQFSVRGRQRTIRDLQKYSRSQGVNEDGLAARASADIKIPDYLRAVTPESDASPVSNSPPDESFRAAQSPQRSLTKSTAGAGADVYVSPPVHGNFFRPSSVDSTSDWSQGGFPFAPIESPDRTFRSAFFGHLQDSPTSSGSASLAMTNSTMATSITSGDHASTRTSQHMLSWDAEAGVHTSQDENVLASSWSSDPISVPSSCDNLSRDVELMSHQLTDPSPLRSRYGADDIESWTLLDLPADGDDPVNLVCTCSVCHQPTATHFVSIHNTVPQEQSRSILNEEGGGIFELPATTKDEGAWKWIALCFAACLNLTKRNDGLANKLLDDASVSFKLLLIRKDPMLLTAANQMITILHMHNQGAIAAKITKSAKLVTDQELSPTDPVRITINYLAATADSSSSKAIEESGITSTVLYNVYTQLEVDPNYGSQHPYTIAAAYNHAWLLKYEGHHQAAEQNLYRIYEKSCSIFGKHHMQSITALATLAGAQNGQKKTKEAMENYKAVIRDCEQTLGKNHPYRLEGKRRLAWQYRDQGRKDKMIPLYWDVLAGRVRMLGPRHSYTLGQKQDYEELMKELGRWDDAAQHQVEMLFDLRRTAEEEAIRRRRSGSQSSNEIECEAY